MSKLDYLRLGLLAVAGVVVCWAYLCVWTSQEASKASLREWREANHRRAQKEHRYFYPAQHIDGKDRRR